MTRAWLRCGLLAMLAWGGVVAVPRADAAVPAAPTNCVVAGMGHSSGLASFRIQWTDASTNESEWIVQVSVNNGAFGLLARLNSASGDTTGTAVSVGYTGSANMPYQFRVYAFNGAGYSSASNVAASTAGLFTLTASKVPCETAITLTWPDIANESGYEVWWWPPGATQYSYKKTVGANVTTDKITGLEPTMVYYFVLLPFMGSYYIGQTDVAFATVDVPAIMTSKTGASGPPGSAFTHNFTHQSAALVSGRALTGTAPGLTFNSSTGVLSGILPATGNYTFNYALTFTSGSVLHQRFDLRVRPPAGPPAPAALIPAWSAAVGASRETDLTGSFVDPEAESALRVATTRGNMDFILFDTATPATVANFMAYVNAGKYAGVAFHRSVGGFVIQGGGYSGAGSGTHFTSVVTSAPVANEPGIANQRGTISMAKLGGDPDSATSQFFISLGDNRANLDYQNGGFTVFGRVAGDGMSVADAIGNLPTRTYNLRLDGSATTTAFSDFPMDAVSAPATMDQTKLVKITSVAVIPTLALSITGNTRPEVASAAIIGGKLRLTGLSGGQTTITVTATDLDNLTASQSVAVELTDTYASWQARQTFAGGDNAPGQDPDGDGWNNLLEYAFLGDPALPWGLPRTVYASTAVTASPEARYLTLTFPLRKFTQGLGYAVEGADGLAGPWTTVWSSADGLVDPQVLGAADQPDRTVVTIRDTVAQATRPQRFLRVVVVQN